MNFRTKLAQIRFETSIRKAQKRRKKSLPVEKPTKNKDYRFNSENKQEALSDNDWHHDSGESWYPDRGDSYYRYDTGFFGLFGF